MRVIHAEPDLLDRFEVVVDQDAEPVDLDEVLIDFVEAIVERRLSGKHSTSAGTPAAEPSISTTGE